MSENIVTLTTGNFESEVKQAGAPLLVDFWAEWCGPCRMVAPVLEKLAVELVGKLRIGKVNVDDESGLAGRYGIQSIPTVLVFRSGELAERSVGLVPIARLRELLQPRVEEKTA